jgi:hypothetical protein
MDESVESQVRRKLTQLREDCDNLVADAENIGESRPELAQEKIPDELIDVNARRQWAKKALEALDTGEPLATLVLSAAP